MRNLIVPALILAFTIYCLIDVVRSEESEIRGLPKLVWVLLVLLFPLAGGAAWLLAGRPRGTKPPGVDRIGRRSPGAVGPDDDPEFLRTIDPPGPGRPGSPPAARHDGAPDGRSQPDPEDGGRDEPEDPSRQDDRRP